MRVCYRDAWDMAAEICLSQLKSLVDDPNAEFQVHISLSLCYTIMNLLFWVCLGT